MIPKRLCPFTFLFLLAFGGAPSLAGAASSSPSPASDQSASYQVAANWAAEKKSLLERADGLDEKIAEIASSLWRFAETALLEQKSAELLADYLESEEFAVERSVAEMPTAFVAEWGSGRPIIGIMAEFDALPNIGNAVEPKRTPRSDQHPHGHGCGHNLFGAASVAAAVLVKETMAAHGLQGTVRLYGAPAEETLVGKVYMAKADLFTDLDAAFDWHPSFETAVINAPTAAMNNFEVEFHGQASHAAFAPWKGRSALDAVELMNFAVNQMREHVEPSARIHYVIPGGGEAPNVVPDNAKVWYYLRDIDRQRVEANYERMMQIVAGAAMATGTSHEVRLLTGVHDSWLNRPLQEAAQANLEALGAPNFDTSFRDFNKELQKSLGFEPTGLDTEVKPLPATEEVTTGGSSDLAEVSRLAPMVTISVAAAGRGLPWHSWVTTATSGHQGAHVAASVAARAVALNALDVILDPGLLARAQEFFEQRRAGSSYRSPLPADQKPRLPE